MIAVDYSHTSRWFPMQIPRLQFDWAMCQLPLELEILKLQFKNFKLVLENFKLPSNGQSSSKMAPMMEERNLDLKLFLSLGPFSSYIVNQIAMLVFALETNDLYDCKSLTELKDNQNDCHFTNSPQEFVYSMHDINCCCFTC